MITEIFFDLRKQAGNLLVSCLFVFACFGRRIDTKYKTVVCGTVRIYLRRKHILFPK